MAKTIVSEGNVLKEFTTVNGAHPGVPIEALFVAKLANFYSRWRGTKHPHDIMRTKEQSSTRK